MSAHRHTGERADAGRAGEPVLRLEGVSKSYGPIDAVVDVSLEVHRGDCVAIVGDNGAGKSTLVKMIAGVHRPDRGAIYLDGELVEFASPAAARDLGVETVYQDLALVNHLDAAANIFLGREEAVGRVGGPFGLLDSRSMREQTRAALDRLHIRIPEVEHKPVGEMSGGQRQAVAIARAVFWGTKLLLLDEPTAALGVVESREVNRIISQLHESGLPLVVVSHNLQHVFEICDRIIVMRRGRKAADLRRDQTSTQEVVAAITGADAVTPAG